MINNNISLVGVISVFYILCSWFCSFKTTPGVAPTCEEQAGMSFGPKFDKDFEITYTYSAEFEVDLQTLSFQLFTQFHNYRVYKLNLY